MIKEGPPKAKPSFGNNLLCEFTTLFDKILNTLVSLDFTLVFLVVKSIKHLKNMNRSISLGVIILVLMGNFCFAQVQICAAKTFTKEQLDSVYATGSGISGPGKPVEGDGYGGMCSGKLLTEKERAKYASGQVWKSGLIPHIKPIWDVHMRDAVIELGGDGYYYLTGSTGDNIWAYNDGVELYRSKDLQKWDYLGLVWSIEKEGGWEKNWRQRKKPVRAIWAPELHYIHHNYYICLSMPPGGISILKSTTGKPTGPYIHATDPNVPLMGGVGPIEQSFLIDPSLFEDTDGKVYFVQGPADKIYKMKDDLSGFDGDPIQVELLNPTTDPTLRRDTANKANQLGFEGATLFKRNGIYYLGSTDKYKGRYSMCLAMSKNIRGPYSMRHESVPCNGGTKFFKAKNGDWFTCFFGDDGNAPWREKPGIIKVDFEKDGRVKVADKQPDFILLK